MDIKPIETNYKGYRFRSRLEARWVVFFDSLGVKWEYEREGWNVAGGYLPDFYIPLFDLWIEIKPEDFDYDDSAFDKISEFGECRRLLLCLGLPPGETDLYLPIDDYKEFRPLLKNAKDHPIAILINGKPYPPSVEKVTIKAKQARFENFTH